MELISKIITTITSSSQLSFVCFFGFIFLLAIILFIFANNLSNNYTAETKGEEGERIVSQYLSELPKNEYGIMNDVMLRIKNKTVQIDHIVVSLYGVFVIETKNYNGWIFGSEKAKYWKQIFKTSRNQIINPVRQNWGHITALKYILYNFKKIKYFSIIAFLEGAELKQIDSTVPVIYAQQIVNTIKSLSSEEVLTLEETRQIVQFLKSRQIDSKEHLKEHVKNIEEAKKIRANKIAKRICPKCGCTLVKRTGKYGDFYGCSNYPLCHFTVNTTRKLR